MRVLLEYYPADGSWHFNCWTGTNWQNEPNTHGYHTVADTDWDTANRFCDMVDILIGDKVIPNIARVKIAWNLFINKEDTEK